jgi:hypothetical protein
MPLIRMCRIRSAAREAITKKRPTQTGRQENFR